MDTCLNCRWYAPQFYQMGFCTRQRQPNSKCWSEDGSKGILVSITYGCTQFEPVPEAGKESL